MAPKIYTKTGDQGKTSLVGGQRVRKDHILIEAYGTIDELNAFLGQSLSFLNEFLSAKNNEPRNANFITTTSYSALIQQWEQIQNHLFNIGSHLACPDLEMQKHLPSVRSLPAENLEKWIDEMNLKLPDLKNFILPGGTPVSSSLHICRTICRRAERLCLKAKEDENTHQNISHDILIFLNRLSDYFFVAARHVNNLNSQPDQFWKK